MYFWIASSLFIDDDYDKVEQKFIDDIIVKYNLQEDKINSVIKTIRDKKIDAAIRDLLNDF